MCYRSICAFAKNNRRCAEFNLSVWSISGPKIRLFCGPLAIFCLYFCHTVRLSAKKSEPAFSLVAGFSCFAPNPKLLEVKPRSYKKNKNQEQPEPKASRGG